MGSTHETYQENDRDVEQESNAGISEERDESDTVNVDHGQSWQLGDHKDAGVDDGAGRGVVVERNEGVHLEVRTAEQTLDHDQANGLENNASDLEEETNHDKFDLAQRSDNDTDDDEGNVAERFHVDWGNAQTPGSEENSNGGRSLS